MGKERDTEASLGSIDVSTLTDLEAVQLMSHPVVARAIKDLAEEAVKEQLEATKRRISDLEAHVKNLETEVEGFRRASDALEISNTYNWGLTDERFKALEGAMTTGEQDEGCRAEGAVIAGEVAGERSEVQRSWFAELRPAHRQTDESRSNRPRDPDSIVGDGNDDSHTTQAIAENDKNDRGNHPKNLSSGHLAVYHEAGKIVLWMPVIGVAMHLKRLLFHSQTRGKKGDSKYECTLIGRHPTEPLYIRPTMDDTVLDQSPGTFKLLLKLYDFLRTRKADLVRQWKIENPDFADRTALPRAYELVPPKSRRFNSLRATNVHERLLVLVPFLPPNGRQSVQARRLLVERAATYGFGVTTDSTAAGKSTYHDVATGQQTQMEIDDVVVPESEEVLERLGLMYAGLEEKDLLDKGPVSNASGQPAKRAREASDKQWARPKKAKGPAWFRNA